MSCEGRTRRRDEFLEVSSSLRFPELRLNERVFFKGLGGKQTFHLGFWGFLKLF